MTESRGAWRAWVGPLFGLGILAVAMRSLAVEMQHVGYQEVANAFDNVPNGRIALAALATLAAYMALPGYDFLALKYAGHPLPWRRVAYGSVVAYGISQTVGFPAVTGGSVRVRLWSAWGLSTPEIARAVGFAGASFSFGVLLLAGVAGLAEPTRSLELLPVPPALTRAVAGVCLAVAVAYMSWSIVAGGRLLRIGPLSVTAPKPRLVLGQIVVAVADWTLAALVLFVLLPSGHVIPFPAFVGVFLIAQSIGVASNVPGGLGVFESLILVQIGDDVAAGPLLGALVVYRLVYYVAPFVVALTLLAIHELKRQRAALSTTAGVVADRFERWAEPLLPMAMGVMTITGGTILLLSGATPPERGRMLRLIGVLPLGVVELSHFGASVAGAGLLVLGWGLTRRLDAAYLLARVILVIGIFASLLKGLDYEEAVALCVVLALLSASRRAFYRRSSLMAEPLTPGWIAAIVAIVSVSIWVGFFSYKHVEYASELWWRFAVRGDAPRFLRASAGAAGALAVLGALRLLRHARPRIALPTPSEIQRVADLLPKIDDTVAALALLGDKHLLFSESGQGFLMYGIGGRTWVALGDPLGSEADRRELAWRFRESADEHGAWPVFYEVTARYLPLYIDLGLTLLKMGEEAIIPLSDFSIDGGGRKGLRRAVRDAEKAGASFEIVGPEAATTLIGQLQAVSDEWLGEKSVREKGFSLGRFDPGYLAHFPHALVRVDGRIVAFANVWTGSGRELSFDLMRHTNDAPPSVMDYLFVQMMLWGRANGFGRMNIGMAPLSGLSGGALAPRWQRIAGLIYGHGERFYNFKGLRKYKDKFDPIWEPRYLATPTGLNLPRVLANVTSLISGGMTGIVTK